MILRGADRQPKKERPFRSNADQLSPLAEPLVARNQNPMPVLASDFFLRLARALELTHNIASTPNAIEGLDSLLDPSLVEQAHEQAGVATLRKRRLPLEMMLWCVISMAFFRRMSAWDMVSRMNIMLPGQRPLVATSAVVQARQRLGSEAVRHVFHLTQKSWHEAAGHPT